MYADIKEYQADVYIAQLVPSFKHRDKVTIKTHSQIDQTKCNSFIEGFSNQHRSGLQLIKEVERKDYSHAHTDLNAKLNDQVFA